MSADADPQLPARVVKAIVQPIARPRRSRRLAQLVVNTVRRFPELHDQHRYTNGCANTACLVGWVNVFGLQLKPDELEREDHDEIPAAFELSIDLSEKEHLWAGTESVLAAHLLGLQTDEDIVRLAKEVYDEPKAEKAIANFCALTGAVDPAKKEQASA